MAGMPVADGTLSFSGGQDDGIPPDRIKENQYRRAVNVTTRNGRLGPRFGFVHKEVEVITDGLLEPLDYEHIYNKGKFQGAVGYDAEDGTYILAIFSGIVYRIDPRTFKADILELPDGDRMNQYRRQIPMERAGRFVVCHDYPNLPIIIENKSIRRSDPTRESLPGLLLPEVPASTMGVEVQGRLHVANAFNEILSGDPIGGINEDAPITFEEALAPAGAFNGTAFSLGTQSGKQAITAMGFLQVPDSSTGVGPLVVGTKKQVHVFRVDLPRDQWKDIAFGKLLLHKAGIAGPRALDNLNSDLLFLSGDNQVRSLLFATREQSRWANTPISREIMPWLSEFANTERLEMSFVVAYKNRVFVAVAPHNAIALDIQGRKVFDSAHGGMAVLELDNVSSLGDEANPAWAGVWTGISPMDMVVLDEGPFVFSKDDGNESGTNRLYFMDENLSYDVFEGKEKNIVSRIYSKEYDFRQPFADKQVGSIDYTFSELEGHFKLAAEYKGSNLARWAMWRSFEHEAKVQTEDAGGADILPNLMPHNLRELHFGDPEERECDELTQDEGTVMRTIGLRLTLSARNWNLKAIRLRFFMVEELDRPSTDTCDTLKEVLVTGENEQNDWEMYRTAPATLWQ